MNVITRQKRYYIDWTVLRKHLIPDRMTVQLRVSDVSQGQEWRSEVLQLNVLRSEVGNQIPVYRISMSILDDHERRITFLEDGYREINEDYTELSGRVDTLESNSKQKEYNSGSPLNSAGFVYHASCTRAAFDAITTKDTDTVYFITDTGEIYKGAIPMGSNITVDGNSITFVTDTKNLTLLGFTAAANGQLCKKNAATGKLEWFTPTYAENNTVVTLTTRVTSLEDAVGDPATRTGIYAELDAKAPIASPALTGAPTAPTPATADDSTKIATTAFVKANLASPAFTGTPTAPTADSSANNTQIATTAFVKANLKLSYYSIGKLTSQLSVTY